ncbi:MAG: metallophosphoesterase [Myxococcaceae bacterium]|jgi:predicted phosphodiesterase|nr:metallophosphoesterase [Myxococcaceae bacterium]
MRLISVEPQPFFRLRYLNAARGGGTTSELLPFHRGTVDVLPPPLEGLVLAADLQGVVPHPRTRESALLGVAVVEALSALGVPALKTCGALLAGDLYSVPEANRRGGFGDVKPVWSAFASRFRWVVGVAGNHDDVTQVRNLPNTEVLDVSVVERDGLRIGGVGLVAGDANKPGRRSEAEQVAGLELVMAERPDVVVLHEGPSGPEGFPGNPALRAGTGDALVVCGHVHWPSARWADDASIVNVCERVLVLTASPPRAPAQRRRRSAF